MTTREKVIVLGMAVAVVWAGTTVGLDYYRKNRAATLADLRKAEIRAFAEGQRALAAPLRLSAPEVAALDEAAAAWAPSPFLDRAVAAEPVEAPVQRFRYTGFIQVGRQQFAIVNGREYRVAEPVAQTDFRVDEIQPDHVVLVSGSGGRRMTVALQSIVEKKESP